VRCFPLSVELNGGGIPRFFVLGVFMKIAGLQKTTLIDYPGEVACTIFLFGCNFRCGFCYNPELVIRGGGEGFTEEEILDFLKKRKDKLDAICITGGEPLMTLDLEFLRKVKALGYKVKLDTNGSFPDKLKEVIDAGLVDYVAMDIKGSRKDYSKITGIDAPLEDIERSIKLISSLPNYEFRTTVVYKFHDAFKMRALGRWLNIVAGKKPKRYFLQGFKVQEDLIDEKLLNEKNVGEKFLNELRDCVSEYFENVGVRA
jgi:pyruvate formate lyase activating enzyme